MKLLLRFDTNRVGLNEKIIFCFDNVGKFQLYSWRYARSALLDELKVAVSSSGSPDERYYATTIK